MHKVKQSYFIEENSISLKGHQRLFLIMKFGIEIS